jgi:hypothetical protein
MNEGEDILWPSAPGTWTIEEGGKDLRSRCQGWRPLAGSGRPRPRASQLLRPREQFAGGQTSPRNSNIRPAHISKSNIMSLPYATTSRFYLAPTVDTEDSAPAVSASVQVEDARAVVGIRLPYNSVSCAYPLRGLHAPQSKRLSKTVGPRGHTRSITCPRVLSPHLLIHLRSRIVD